MDNNGQRGEAEDEDGSTSNISIVCTCDHDLLIPIKANQPMTKSQCFHILLRVKCTMLYYDASFNYAMQEESLVFHNSLVAVNPSLLHLKNSSVITYTNFMHASSGLPPEIEHLDLSSTNSYSSLQILDLHAAPTRFYDL